MAGFESFDRELRLATKGLEPAAINAALARFARSELAKAISAGASPQYTKYVNGREGAPEETVQAPGPIVYEFVNWPLVIDAAISELLRRAPRKTGRFHASFIVIANQRLVTDYRQIAPYAEVIITNFQPYVRRVEAGKRIGQKRVFDSSKNALSRRYGDLFRFETRFLNIATGVHPEIPYILKGGAPLRAAAMNSRSSVFRAGGTHLARRKDTMAGQALTYPSIVINAL